LISSSTPQARDKQVTTSKPLCSLCLCGSLLVLMYMINIETISCNLGLDSDGIWKSKTSRKISFPQTGYNECLSVEDDSFWFKHRNNILVEVLKLFPPNGAIFDIGAGNGVVSIALQNNGFDVVLVEPGTDAVFNAKMRGVRNIICSTFEDAGFKEKILPAIGLFDVLEHMENDSDILSLMKRSLINDGRLYITVPAYQFLWSSEDIITGHYRRYRLGNLSTLLKKCGFDIEFATYFFTILPLPIFLFRTLPTLLLIRKEGSVELTTKEHNLKPNMLGTILNRIFKAELTLIKNRREIGFGGSCFIVAKSR
jgi:SAM-dependent methyltransferase